MIDHGQEKGAIADQWSGSEGGTAVALFPVRSLDKRDIAATSSCNVLEFVLYKRCVTPKNDDKSLDARGE